MTASNELNNDIAAVFNSANNVFNVPSACLSRSSCSLVTMSIKLETCPTKNLHPVLKWSKSKEQRTFAIILSIEAPSGTKRTVIATANEEIKTFKKDITKHDDEIKKSAWFKALKSYGNIESYVMRLDAAKDQNKHKKFDDLLINIHEATACVYIYIKALEKLKAKLVSYVTSQLPICVQSSRGILPKRRGLKASNKTVSVIMSPRLWCDYLEPLMVKVDRILQTLNNIKKSVETYDTDKCCKMTKMSGKKSATERMNDAKERKKKKRQ
eukprot:58081_1